MSFESNRQREPEELSAAWRNWKTLVEEAERFFSLPEVQEALNNDTYRLTKFTAEFDSETRARARPRRWDAKSDARGRFRSFWQMTNAIDCAANHTQKMLHKIGKFDGLLEMSKIMETCDLLIRGSTIESSYQDIETIVLPEVQTIEGLRIHFVFAFMNLVHATKGKLYPNHPKRKKSETHALHTVVTHDDSEVLARIKPINGFATNEQLRHGYAYGDVDEEKISNRILGLRIRTSHMHAYGMQKRQQSGFHDPPKLGRNHSYLRGMYGESTGTYEPDILYKTMGHRSGGKRWEIDQSETRECTYASL